MAAAPRRAAVSSAAARLANDAVLASTTRILQGGQAADTMATSRVSSTPHPAGSGWGSGDGLPCWLTIRRQPGAVVQASSPDWVRSTARALARCGGL